MLIRNVGDFESSELGHTKYTLACIRRDYLGQTCNGPISLPAGSQKLLHNFDGTAGAESFSIEVGISNNSENRILFRTS